MLQTVLEQDRPLILGRFNTTKEKDGSDSTSWQSVDSITVPADSLTEEKSLQVVWHGFAWNAQAGSGSIEFGILLGSTRCLVFSDTFTNGAGQYYPFYIQGTISCKDDDEQRATGFYVVEINGGVTDGSHATADAHRISRHSSMAEDLTSDLTLAVQVDFDVADSDIGVRSQGGYVLLI